MSASPQQFQSQVGEVALRVRRAVGTALKRAGADLERPQNAARKLGLDKSLAWKTVRLVTEEDMLAAMGRIPGRAGQRILLDALTKAGVPVPLVQELGAAFDDYERLIDTHAGDRDTLEIMLTQLSAESRRNAEESHRRQAFQGNCAIWGVQAHAQVGGHLIMPMHGEPEKLTIGMFNGLVDMRRLRENTDWVVATARLLTDDGKPMSLHFGPLDPSVDVEKDPPVLREFCTDPQMALKQVPTKSGVMRLEMSGGSVGLSGALTCFVGHYHRVGVPRYANAEHQLGQHFTTISTPAEWLLLDLLVHKSLDFAMTPELRLHSLLPNAPQFLGDDSDKSVIPLSVSPERIDDLEKTPTPEFEAMPRILGFAAKRLGYSLSDFVGFRLKLHYPPVPTIVAFRYRLPSPPGGSQT